MSLELNTVQVFTWNLTFCESFELSFLCGNLLMGAVHIVQIRDIFMLTCDFWRVGKAKMC